MYLVPGAEPPVPDNGGAELRRAADGAHVLQPAVPARLRLLRAARARAALGHQRGRGGLRHDLGSRYHQDLSNTYNVDSGYGTFVSALLEIHGN